MDNSTGASGADPNDILWHNMTAEHKARLLAADASREPQAKSLAPIPLADLMRRNYAPLEFLVDGLIARGYLCMLAGRPKGGKSWAVFQLSQAIDQGTEFLGRQTIKGKVLHLALEDGERRVYQRANLLRWHPDQAEIAIEIGDFDDGAGGLGDGLAQLRYAATSGGYDLIVIDTLISTLTGKASENNNTEMGQIVNTIARIAHDTNVAIVLVHHTGKQISDDPFALLRGASAIRGAYDLGMVLDRKQNEREAILHIEARDFEGTSMTLQQVPNGAGWQCLGNLGVLHEIRAGRVAVDMLIEHGEGLSVGELAELTGKAESTVHRSLKTAIKHGHVTESRDTRPYTYWLAGAHNDASNQ